MAAWAFVCQTVAGQMIGEVLHARDRKVTFDLRGPATAGFQIDSDDEVGDALYELQTDLLVYRRQDDANPELVFRGRLGSADDDLDADTHRTSWSAVDYRGMLDRRSVRETATFTNAEQTEIAWQLVNTAQTGLAGGLNITRGSRPGSGRYVNRTETFEAGVKVSEALNKLQDYEDGFDWWVDPQLRFHCARYRGTVKGSFPLVWGVNATTLKRAYDTGNYANWVRVTGGQAEGKTDQAAPVATRYATGLNLTNYPGGRFELVVQNQDLKTQNAVNAAAAQLLKDSLNPPASYSAQLTPDVWQGPADLWVGDTTRLYIRSGRLQMQARARVSQIDVTITDEGEEQVAVTLGEGQESTLPTAVSAGLEADEGEDSERIGPRLDRDTPVIVTQQLLDRVGRVERGVSGLSA